MSDFVEFSFGMDDDKIGGKRFDRYKGKEGETERLSFVWWYLDEGGKPIFNWDGLPKEVLAKVTPAIRAASEEPPPRFTGAKRFYIPGVGYVLDKGPEMAKLAGQASKPTIATIVVVWPTDRNGQVNATRLEAGEFDVKPWVFSRDKYDMLSARHNEFPLGQHDIQAKCTDTQYQKMDIVPCKENLFRKVLGSEKLAHIAQKIMDQVIECEANIRDRIATDMSVAQVREKLGGGGGTSATFNPDTTAAVDAILDDVLAE